MAELKPISGSYSQALDIDYFHWLCHSILGKSKNAPWDILELLHASTFYPIIKMDENRVEDAKSLRSTYLDDATNCRSSCEGYPRHVLDIFISKPCSILELMVSISSRMSFEVQLDMTEKNAIKYHFWDIYANLLDGVNYEDINYIINVFVGRKYDKNGVGGLFPLHKNTKNQKKVELWYQMMAYLQENYPLN